ncbi:predicted protein [Histoplasma capsulatum G186AR]|uniref:Uncharacterized protein n=1 Tax=Ajellomyces capsulatus (strain G186AR / H82 / ATCC MYA-2454 / RMSCC 2432) TaxID=447093 RepID=C0NUR6_AJECG|nr:uncharacterized protein HCBG_06680 [Histoplasma capsulatum G186AR]EEH04729.1 predicted protein [Histoplasma capsulatum G186AR]
MAKTHNLTTVLILRVAFLSLLTVKYVIFEAVSAELGQQKMMCLACFKPVKPITSQLLLGIGGPFSTGEVTTPQCEGAWTVQAQGFLSSLDAECLPKISPYFNPALCFIIDIFTYGVQASKLARGQFSCSKRQGEKVVGALHLI